MNNKVLLETHVGVLVLKTGCEAILNKSRSIKETVMGYGMLNTKSTERKTIDLLVPVFLIGIILVSSGCVTTLNFVDAKKKSNTGDTGGGGTTQGGTTTGGTGGTGETGTGGTGGTPETQPQTPPQEQPTPNTPPPTPTIKFKGNTQIQDCTAAGVVALNECTQTMNINNIHKTTIREGGSTLVVGQPATTASGATPVILYIQGVGYVQVTGIQASGSGQATISYVVLVPAK